MKNEKGITLIELLAALTILAIISSVIYSVFFEINNNYNNISSKINLDQEANIIFSTIKNYHLHNNQYKLSYDPSSKTYLIGTSTANNQIGINSDLVSLSITSTINGNIVTIPILNKPQDQTINVSIYKSINVTIQLANQQPISTIIRRY